MQGDAAAAALAYSRRGWRCFPCRLDNKQPLVKDWPRVASGNEVQIKEWWRRWPFAAVGVPTGRSGAGFVVLDIDIKRFEQNGFDTLAELGHAVLPDTPMVHTRSGGLHVYFDPGERSIRNTAGAKGRGIGRGLDIRGDGGYVIVPSSGSGYRWDPIYKLDDVPLAPAPAWLAAPAPEQRRAARPVRPSRGLSPYAEAALDGACRRIINAPNGEQEATLNGEAFTIGTLAGAGGLPADIARRTLHWAALQVHNYDPGRPWSPAELEGKIDRAFVDGLRRPREVRHG